MTDDEPWAAATLRIVSDQLPATEVAARLGRASTARDDRVWAADLAASSDVPPADQLAAAADFLRTHQAALRALAPADISLRLSWTPRRPQDGLALTPDLIALLAAVDAYLLLDTYLD
jgi:hypothetical protein